MNTATVVKELPVRAGGKKILYKLSTPMIYDDLDDKGDEYKEVKKETEYVVVSSLSAAFDTGRPETYIFPADKEGHVVSWGEIGASQRGTTSHKKVLRESGYTIKT